MHCTALHCTEDETTTALMQRNQFECKTCYTLNRKTLNDVRFTIKNYLFDMERNFTDNCPFIKIYEVKMNHLLEGGCIYSNIPI